jgi:hypothetical protein
MKHILNNFYAPYAITILAAVLSARELGWVRFPLPQLKRQTEKCFAHEFGFLWASGMWGAHIGFGMTTRVTHGGYWVLVAACLLNGNCVFGMSLMICYWVGRALPLWVAPLLQAKHRSQDLLEEVIIMRPFHSRLAGLTLGCTTGLLALLSRGLW